MLRRWLTLGMAVFLVLTIGELAGCGRRHHRHYDDHTYRTTADPPHDQADPGPPGARPHMHPVNVARVEQGAERYTRQLTEGITALAEGLELGVVEGAKDGAREAREHNRERERERDRSRHRRHRFSYTFEENPPPDERRAAED
jgi:hypothetical protein